MRNPYTCISVFLAFTVAGTVLVTVQAGSKSPMKTSDKVVDDWSAVSSAIKKGDRGAVKRLIAKADMANLREPGPWGRSLLHVAAATSSKHPEASLEITKLLIEKGADVNARMRSGLAPLHEAARSGSDTIAKLLIESGAKLNEQVLIKNCLDPDYDMNGFTPTDAALFYEHKAVTALLRKNGGKANKLQDGQAGDTDKDWTLVDGRSALYREMPESETVLRGKLIVRDFSSPDIQTVRAPLEYWLKTGRFKKIPLRVNNGLLPALDGKTVEVKGKMQKRRWRSDVLHVGWIRAVSTNAEQISGLDADKPRRSG